MSFTNGLVHFSRATVVLASLLLSTKSVALEFNLAQLDGTNGFTANGHTAFDFLGGAVSPAGDLNGDGHADVLVGAYGEAVSDAGQVSVLFGRDVSGSGPFPQFLEIGTLGGSDGFVINGTGTNERAGTALASIGDVNGDGIDDVLIGAPGNNVNSSLSGAAYVLFGRDTTQPGISFPNPFELSGLVTGGGTDGFVMYGANANDNTGDSVAGGFDLNGDGIADLAVGAPGTDVNGSTSGEVYVIFGRDTGTVGNFAETRLLPDLASGDGSEGFVLRGGSADARAGISLAFVGDINNDGFDDLIIGATHQSDAASPGQAYVIFGKDTSVSGTFPAVFELSTLAGGGGAEGFVLNGIGTDDELGAAVGAAGDVNGDAIDDLIVGDPSADDNGDGAGQAYVVFGRDTSTVGNFPGQFELSTLAAGGGAEGFVLNGRQIGSPAFGAGAQVGSAGDFSGDGVGDLFVGDRDASSSSVSGAGEVYIVYGQDTGAVGNFDAVIELGDLAADAGTEGLVIHGQDNFDRVGAAVALAGDIDGDGRADLVIGAGEADPNGGNSGEAYVIFSPGRINTPPTVSTASLVSSLEDVATSLGPDFMITDADGHAQTVTMSLSGDVAVLHLEPVAGVTISGNDTTELLLSGALADINTALPQVEVVPHPDENGGVTLQIATNDGFFVEQGFSTVSFQPVNDPPVLNFGPSPVEVLEDAGDVFIKDYIFEVGSGDPEQTSFEVTFEAFNDNNDLFVNQPLLSAFFSLLNTGSDLYFELVPDVNGSATVNFTATDDGGTANGGDDTTTGQFEIVVLPVNDPPVFTLLGDREVEEDAGPRSVSDFATGMDDGDPEQTQALTFTLESDNPGLFSSPPAIDEPGTLTFTTAPDAFGVATVTVTLSDDGGTANGGIDSSSQDFTLTVNGINDPPTFIAGDDVEAPDTDGPVSIPNWATAISPGPNESGQSVSFSVIGNTAPGLFSAGPAVSPDGTLSFTPAEGTVGSATVDIVLMDDGEAGGVHDDTSDPQSFTITIEPGLLADLAITKGNGAAFLNGIDPVTWTISVENFGPEDVEGAMVEDLIPPTVNNASWTCTPSGGATCTASGNGDLLDTVDIPAGSGVVYTLTADVVAGEDEVVENTAEVIPPEIPVDLYPDNNIAADRDPIGVFFDSFEASEEQ